MDKDPRAPTRTVTLRIRRFKPSGSSAPMWHDFEVEVAADATALDALDVVRREHDRGLIYRCSCRHGSCGTCGCRIDGVERLTCLTPLSELGDGPITIEPLRSLPLVGDLAVDPSPMYRTLAADWPVLRQSEGAGMKETPAGVKRLTRLEDCIECGLCQSACPETGSDQPFDGPATMAAINRQRRNVPGAAEALLDRAGDDRGVRHCRRVIDCSRRCPTGVSPARHIAELQRLVDGEQGS